MSDTDCSTKHVDFQAKFQSRSCLTCSHYGSGDSGFQKLFPVFFFNTSTQSTGKSPSSLVKCLLCNLLSEKLSETLINRIWSKLCSDGWTPSCITIVGFWWVSEHFLWRSIFSTLTWFFSSLMLLCSCCPTALRLGYPQQCERKRAGRPRIAAGKPNKWNMQLNMKSMCPNEW